MHPIVATLTSADASWLGRWRTLPGYQACEVSGQVWVRGPESTEWERLPALARYTADDAGRLTPVGKRLPVTRLPEGPWLPLAEFLRVRPAAAALPALHLAPVAWALVPSEEYRAAEMLMLPFADFARWGLGAPAVRLQSLRFAVSEDHRACVIGALLPTLPGQAWCVQDRIATPAGWALPKGITPALVASSMKLSSREIALLHPDGTSERLPAEAFVEVTRSALRATKTSFAI